MSAISQLISTEKEQEIDVMDKKQDNPMETHQRKRSKVSRACDQCRRKKIRCDAILNYSSNKLEKSCTSCIKNELLCSFERVPLKRGPTKGYSKQDSNTDSQYQLNQSNQNNGVQKDSSNLRSNITLPPLNSITSGTTFSQLQSQTPSLNSFNFHQQSQQDQQQSTQASASASALASAQAQAQAQAQAPSSPQRKESTSSKRDSQTQQNFPINTFNASLPQSQFWKVPYQPQFDRRGSIESISSSYSSISLPPNPDFIPRYESSVILDSDDERNISPRTSLDLRTRSRSNSSNNVPPSPVLSLNSLKSLNSGFSKNLNLNGNNLQQSNGNNNHYSQSNNINYLLEAYYKSIHPTMTILPLNDHFLVTILSKQQEQQQQQPQNEIEEFIFYINRFFYNCLDLLISILSRQRSSVISPNSIESITQSNESLRFIFNNLSRFFKLSILQFDQLPRHSIILFLSSLTILSYIVLLLGDSSDVIIINSTYRLFERLKIYQLFWSKNEQQNERVIENYDEFELILKRNWLTINLIDSLHSLSNGILKQTLFQIEFEQIDKLYPDLKSFKLVKDHLKLGLILSKICETRVFSPLENNDNDNTDNNNNNNNNFTIFEDYIIKITKNWIPDSSNEQLSLPLQFWEFISIKLELIKFLNEITYSLPKSIKHKYDKELLYDHQFKLLRFIKKAITSQNNLFDLITNYTNSIESGDNPISPILPIIFKQSIKSLNIIKILINSLQLNESLAIRLSKLLNDLINLSNFLSQLKPFLNPELNNHLNFKFNSNNLKYWEIELIQSQKDIDEVKIQQCWINLMKDVLNYLKQEDYEGWF